MLKGKKEKIVQQEVQLKRTNLRKKNFNIIVSYLIPEPFPTAIALSSL